MSEPTWRKSTYSGHQGDCVETALVGECIGVRDSKDPDGGQLSLTREQFAGLVATVKAGMLDDLT